MSSPQFSEKTLTLQERVRSKARSLLAERRAEKDRANPHKFTEDPAGFARVILREHLWSKQREIAESVRDNRRTSVPSCHDAGKSFLAARIACWWLTTNPIGDAFVVTSAPTAVQVKVILWREINRAHRRGNLPGKVNQLEWFMGGELVGFGRKPSDVDMTGFQGIHARKVLVIFDEACGIPKLLWDAADTLITNDESRFLAIGNPDDPSSHFATVSKPGSGWNTISIDAMETPNLTGEEVPDALRPLLIGKTWIEEKRKSWGEDSPLYIAKVRGQFPEIADDALISAVWVREAVDRDLPDEGDNELGVDVARYGNDESVVAHRKGGRARLYRTSRNRATTHLVGMVVSAIRDTGATRVKIDDIGVGGGVTDRLQELRREGVHNAEIVPINVGGSVTSEKLKPVFFNLRAELHWMMRERFRTGTIDIEADEDLQGQAVAMKYELKSNGQIQIESKDDMKDRKLPSPDRFEALMLAFAPAKGALVFALPGSVVTTPIGQAVNQ